MQLYRIPLRSVMFSLVVFSSPLLANDCGEVPQSPELVDGETATMDELVANSESVKTFIADADAYLDCNEAFVTSKDFKQLDAAEQKKYLDLNSSLLKDRNDIGEDFNTEVTEYKAANPQ